LYTELLFKINRERSLMKTLLQLVIISLLMAIAAPAYSASVSHIFKCEQDDDASQADLMAVASKILAAAKGVEGGKNLRMSMHLPLAGANGSTDFALILTLPSAAEWGTFSDNYAGSAAAAFNGEWDELAACPDSSLIKSVEVE
jgi:hypothetical protein